MARNARFWSSPELSVFLFCLFLILLGWPFVSIADHHNPGYFTFIYLFVTWSLMIIALFVLGKSVRKHLEINEDTQEKS